MIFLGNLTKISDDNFTVGLVHFFPFDQVNGMGKTQEELEQEGVLIEELPPNLATIKQIGVLRVNPITKVASYAYQDLPETNLDKKIAQLENQTAEYMVDLDFRLSNIELGL